MTIEEIKVEAEKLGYYVVRKRTPKNPYFEKKKCKDCIWLDMNEKSTIGYVCKNPYKNFKTMTAKYKYSYAPCCSKFAEKSKSS